ncbi:MAG: hypothetical protein H0Z32_04615 [Bacillaceae bacterium]|nr:hypothetical protein [Bacillaceae bacterium]
MIYLIDTLSMLIRFLFSYGTLFLLLPIAVISFQGKKRLWSEKVFILLIYSHVYFIAMSHLLVFIRLYDALSLYLLTAATIIFVIFYWSRKDDIPKNVKLFVKLFNLSEQRIQWRVTASRVLKEWRTAFIQGFGRKIQTVKKDYVYIVSITILVGTGIFLRFSHAITQLQLGNAEAYAYILRAKQYSENYIYTDFVFPNGFEAVVSVMNKFFHLDPYVIIRFIGPMISVLIILSVYLAIRKISSINRWGLWIVLAIYFLSNWLPFYDHPSFPDIALKYGAVFFVPGIIFLIQYFEKGRIEDLVFSGGSLMISIFFHFYTGIALMTAMIIIGMIYIMGKGSIRSLLAMMSISITIPMLPILIGLLFKGNLYPGMSQFNVFQFREYHSLIVFLFALFIYLLIHMFVEIKNGNTVEKSKVIFYALFCFFYLSFAFVQWFESMSTMDWLGIYLAILTLIAIGNVIPLWTKNLKQIYMIMLAFGLAAIILIFPWRVSTERGYLLQYNEAVQSYLTIKETYDRYNWTIVSPVEEYSLSYGYGWHSNIWEFADQISDSEVEEIRFKTDHIFVFVEKVPIGTEKPIDRSDALSPVPNMTSSDLNEDETGFYYRNPVHRRVIEAKVYQWANTIRKRSDEISVFYENDHFVVYHIHQDRNKPLNLKNFNFYDSGSLKGEYDG